MKNLDEELKNQNTTKIKIFSNGYKNIQSLEDHVNSWLFENSHLNIVDIKTTSNATVGSDSFFSDELFLIVIYN
ncbi:MAG: hypothetical protein ACQEWV_26425 [Bacillota bacterium]